MQGPSCRKLIKESTEVASKGDFYIIDKKIYIFTKTKDYSRLNGVLTDIAEPLSKPAHIN